jgi:hypothetical protein
VNDAQAAIHDEIVSLLAAPEQGANSPSLAYLEDTLTAGYARALELEGERLRVERQIGEVTSQLGDEADPERAEELAALAERVSQADGDLRRLRRVLASLHARASALRAAGAVIVF